MGEKTAQSHQAAFCQIHKSVLDLLLQTVLCFLLFFFHSQLSPPDLRAIFISLNEDLTEGKQNATGCERDCLFDFSPFSCKRAQVLSLYSCKTVDSA